MARIRLLRQQTLFSNQSSMIKFAKKTLEPVLLEIFKNTDKDIYLSDYAVDPVEDELDSWAIKEVVFNTFSVVPYEAAVLCFKNGINVTVAARYSDYTQMLTTRPSINDIVKYVLKYARQPINFIGTDSKPITPGKLLENMIFIRDMEGIEIIGNTYGAEIDISLVDYFLNYQLSKEEVDGELVAWLLNFKRQYFGFNGSRDLPVL